MNKKLDLWKSQNLFWLVLLAACLVYFTGIAHESIWFDEAYSAMMAGHSPGELLRLVTTDNHPPLYYLLLSGFTAVFGNSVWALRLPSVLGAVGLVGLAAGPVRRLFGNRTALIYAGVVIFTPIVLIYAHEARMYSLAAFCVAAGALYGYLAVRENRTKDWILFGAATLAAAYLHYYGLMAAFFMHLLVLLWAFFKQRASLKPALITGGAVAVGYLPWVVFFIRQVIVINQWFWVSPVSWPGIRNALLQPFAYKDAYPAFTPWMAAVLIGSGLVIAAGLALAKRKGGDAWTFGRFLFTVWLCSFITPILISLVSRPIFYARYVTVLTGLFLLLLSLGISLLPKTWLQAAVVGLFALANVPTLANIYTQNFNTRLDQVAEYLQKEMHPGEPIVTSELLAMGPAYYYLPQAGHYNTKSNSGDSLEQVLKEPFLPGLHKDREVDMLLSTHPTFWYVTVNSGLAKNVGAVLLGESGWETGGEPMTFAGPFTSLGVTVTKYVYTHKVEAPKFGALNLHIAGLRPPGTLLIALFNSESAYPTQPSLVTFTDFSDKEITYSLDSLDMGDYVIYVFHDANNNKSPDRDSATGMFTEGYGWANMAKVDIKDGEAVKVGTSWAKSKYAFTQDGQTAEIDLIYPPFPWENK